MTCTPCIIPDFLKPDYAEIDYKILVECAAHYFSKRNVSKEDFYGSCCKREAVEARIFTVSYLHRISPLTLFSIGAFFSRHHTSVIHYIRQHVNLCNVEVDYRMRYGLFAEYLSEILKQIKTAA